MSEEKETESEKENVLTAKKISKIFKFIATGGIVICAVLKWVGALPDATISGVCTVWAVVYGLGAGTIDLNIMFDKFCGNRTCNNER